MNLANRILFVDDDALLLDSMRRLLRGKFDICIAHDAAEGLRKLEEEGPFAVVVTDLRMPGMDGLALLDQVCRRRPDCVRMMLTGNADLATAMRAVNEGQVFRFLTKPCQPDDLEKVLYEGLRQYQLVQTEREYYHLKKLNESMAGVVNALVRLVEMRDPYTAGHQAAVANLAMATAKGMGLADRQVREIGLAATIHDIGKIYAPAEYLCKPGPLMPVEFAIIKMHPQIGHDILEPINFSFPIHKIVLQHHERMDGSGYPKGLAGPEIMLEARVIAVADVVEAICSHRPYRPAKGLAVAMDEIEGRRGQLYDEVVVDHMMEVLREGAHNAFDSTGLIG